MLVGVLLITALVYMRCLGNGFVFDDYPAIVQNDALAQWSFIWKSPFHDLWWFRDPQRLPQSAYYRPLQNVWLALNYHLVGLSPVGWHVLKILLHLVVVLLSFRLAQLLTGSVGAALLAALLFGVLPVHVESVIWAEAIPEPLAAVFELSALCLFIRRASARGRGLVLSLFLFAGALLSHESAIVFPLLVAAYVFFFQKAGTQSEPDIFSPRVTAISVASRMWSALQRSAPFFAVALLYLGIRAMLFGGSLFGFAHPPVVHPTIIKDTLVFVRPRPIHTLAQLLATMPGVLVFYVGLLLMPWRVGPAHNVDFATPLGLHNFVVPTAVAAAIIALGYFALRRSPRRELYLFCAAWWLISLGPALNLDHVSALVQDRYEYLASFGFCVMAGDLAVEAAGKNITRKRIVTVLATAVISVYVAVLWRAELIWHDNVTLFSRSVEMSPGSAYYHKALAQALMDSGDLNGATQQLTVASRLAPDDSAIHLALGLLYMRMNRDHDAAREMNAYNASHPAPIH
jgi:protein O-mannosyl-transferase